MSKFGESGWRTIFGVAWAKRFPDNILENYEGKLAIFVKYLSELLNRSGWIIQYS